VLKDVKRQKLSIVKIDIGTHDGIENYDGPKLDKLYEFDLDNRKIDPNPKKLMQVQRFAGDEKKTIRLDNKRLTKNNDLERAIARMNKTNKDEQAILKKVQKVSQKPNQPLVVKRSVSPQRQSRQGLNPLTEDQRNEVKHALLDPAFFEKIKRELEKVN
jgi:hypothetical protein